MPKASLDSTVGESVKFGRRAKFSQKRGLFPEIIGWHILKEVFAGKLKKAYEMEEMIKPIGRPKKEAK